MNVIWHDVIEFQGNVNQVGESRGHYICDLQEQKSGLWFRTNDNSHPVQIQRNQVTQSAYVVLMNRTNWLKIYIYINQSW